jgi:hypothetical protein
MRIDLIRGSGTYTVTALDPGGHTGIAMFAQSLMVNPDNEVEWLGSGSVPLSARFDFLTLGPGEHHEKLLRFLEHQRHDNMHLVCESFQNRGMGKEIVSAEYIGVVKAFVQESNQMTMFREREWYFEQVAATIKGNDNVFWTDDKVKQLGLWAPNRRHEMDALKHLLHHMTFTLQDERWFQLLK